MRLPLHIQGFPSVPIARPFRLFGRRFEVKLSSHLTMLPEMFLWTTAGMSFQQVAEALSDATGRSMKALQRGTTGANTLSPTTLARARQLMDSPLMRDVPCWPTLDELSAALPPGNAWQVIEQTLREAEGTDLYDLFRRFAELEALPEKVRSLVAQGCHAQAEELIQREIGKPDGYWATRNMPVKAYLIIDVALQVIARVQNTPRAHSETGGKPRSCPFISLLEAKKTPLGHWLVRQKRFAGCTSLNRLGERLHQITPDRLKYWSSGRDLMPPTAARSLLECLGAAVDVDVEMQRYRYARFLSFLIEFVICATVGEPPSWIEAQTMIRERYRELISLAIAENVG